jgi:hypothetical protein
MYHRSGYTDDPLLITLNQHAKRLAIASLGAPEQVVLVVLESADASQFG